MESKHELRGRNYALRELRPDDSEVVGLGLPQLHVVHRVCVPYAHQGLQSEQEGRMGPLRTKDMDARSEALQQRSGFFCYLCRCNRDDLVCVRTWRHRADHQAFHVSIAQRCKFHTLKPTCLIFQIYLKSIFRYSSVGRSTIVPFSAAEETTRLEFLLKCLAEVVIANPSYSPVVKFK